MNKNIQSNKINLLRIDPASVSGPFQDATVWPGGMACRVKTFGPNSYSSTAGLDILLTEYLDPAIPGILEDELLIK